MGFWRDAFSIPEFSHKHYSSRDTFLCYLFSFQSTTRKNNGGAGTQNQNQIRRPIGLKQNREIYRPPYPLPLHLQMRSDHPGEFCLLGIRIRKTCGNLYRITKPLDYQNHPPRLPRSFKIQSIIQRQAYRQLYPSNHDRLMDIRFCHHRIQNIRHQYRNNAGYFRSSLSHLLIDIPRYHSRVRRQRTSITK